MYFITTQQYDARKHSIGGKAKALLLLSNEKLNIPPWVVMPNECFAEIINSSDATDIISTIKNYQISDDFIATIVQAFPNEKYFAVRSSAVDEDGDNFSFAGQFESFLYVTKETLAEKIKQVWLSAYAERIKQYRKNNKLIKNNGISVIIQQMIPAEVSGVGFSINIMNADRDATLINTVYGLGEALVQGKENADCFIIKNEKIESSIVKKVYQTIFDNNEIKKIPVEADKQEKASLTDEQIVAVSKIIRTCVNHFGKPQDIEFAISNNTIYLLQSRAITGLQNISDKKGKYILWDNSNIIESYPGVTTPLTFSFISKSYEKAYKLFSLYMGVSEQVIQKNERIYSHTLGLINGRVYYNLKTWYHMLALLPGYSINARFMEKMMGVKESFDIPESYRLSKTKAWWSIVKMAAKMTRRFVGLPKKRIEFLALLNNTIAEYKNINFGEKNANELMQLFIRFDNTLLNEWKAPLLNDFFAMIWFGLLQKKCEKYNLSKNLNIHNDLLCGSNDIISTQPIHRTIAITSEVLENESYKTLFLNNDENNILEELLSNKIYAPLKNSIDKYLFDFGERCIGELKLESISYNQAPTKFIKIIKSYVESGITKASISSNTEIQVREAAEKQMRIAFVNNPIKQFLFYRTLQKTRALVSARENLRYERTRAFGIVREIFTAMGKHFFTENIIENVSDIFYLKIEEIFDFIEGKSVTQNIRALITLRKETFLEYEKQPTPSERFATYGIVYHANDFYSTARVDQIDGHLKGIGCCPGIVEAKVRVVLQPQDVVSLNGDILVTSSTDPGWVTLFSSAAGIIVERGSVLSHSAIVSREMGKPCIVGVTGLLKTLQTGDTIQMNGSTGEIKIIIKAN
ncbi:MAG: PEP/pyruvate-binding domain-containing protein [Ferruginibacter sp.]|nr:phosphoenolpyruvate synthase [Ferruginibacter sp.]